MNQLPYIYGEKNFTTKKDNFLKFPNLPNDMMKANMLKTIIGFKRNDFHRDLSDDSESEYKNIDIEDCKGNYLLISEARRMQEKLEKAYWNAEWSRNTKYFIGDYRDFLDVYSEIYVDNDRNINIMDNFYSNVSALNMKYHEKKKEIETQKQKIEE